MLNRDLDENRTGIKNKGLWKSKLRTYYCCCRCCCGCCCLRSCRCPGCRCLHCPANLCSWPRWSGKCSVAPGRRPWRCRHWCRHLGCTASWRCYMRQIPPLSCSLSRVIQPEETPLQIVYGCNEAGGAAWRRPEKSAGQGRDMIAMPLVKANKRREKNVARTLVSSWIRPAGSVPSALAFYLCDTLLPPFCPDISYLAFPTLSM